MAGGRLDGKNAVISGGAAGVGGAASEIFAGEGANVAIIDIQEEVGTELAAEICRNGGQAFFVKADVSSSDEVTAAISQVNERFENRIDVLFNHAGTVIIKPFLETTESEWDWMMNVNVKSMFLMTRAVLPSMLGNGSGASGGGGAIVNTSSISAVAGTPMEVLYCTSKGACHMFTRAIATEYRDRGIRCNAVCPGFIRTAHGIRELKELQDYNVEVTEEDICRLQGRICEPEEVANVALFLASSDASFVNGETLFVDNGMLVST
jgi:NAD(P)-dependent dehydrogenase (short-subunit alcohol dehydrogenase family)